MILSSLEEEKRKHYKLLESIDLIITSLNKSKNNIEELNNILEKSINIDDYPIIDNEYKNNLNKVEDIINTLQKIIKPSIESKINFINGEIEIIEKNNIRA